ncbi:MAG: hypothetical protein H6738_23910 [Alphaproteobacteria bacterium]|nr:hypothetical protein [Alphaproteobacteria bacterium]MCB9699854.1 hypothetical protein [Alphaproteobacteria bacterium]
MSFQLDTGSDPEEEPNLELASDELKAAAAAIRHWEGELAERVADAQSLDKWWMVVWTQLTGTRDDKLEAAVRAVAETQHKLEQARAVLERARDGKQAAVEHRDAKMTQEFERIAALEELASRIRSDGGPLADKLLEIELESDVLTARHRAMIDACSAASGVIAAANLISRRAGSAKEHARGDAMGVPFAGMLEFSDIHKLKQQHGDYLERVERLERALQEVGVTFQAGGTERPPSWLAEIAWDAGGGGMDWLRANRHHAKQLAFDNIADEARMLAGHLRQEAATLKERVDQLADERERILAEAGESPPPATA